MLLAAIGKCSVCIVCEEALYDHKLYHPCGLNSSLMVQCLNVCVLVHSAREALRQCLPDQLKDNTFANCLKEDNSTKKWLVQLVKNLETPGLPSGPGNALTMPTPGQAVPGLLQVSGISGLTGL